MMRRTTIARGFENWPWPANLPLKKGWFERLPSTQSLAKETRHVQLIGDAAVCMTLCFLAYRAYVHAADGNYQTRLRHTNGMPPAIVAHEFDFAAPENNRKVTRAQLDEYRAEYAVSKATGENVEAIIFKY